MCVYLLIFYMYGCRIDIIGVYTCTCVRILVASDPIYYATIYHLSVCTHLNMNIDDNGD